MRVLHLSTYDIRGGAARAAYRIHRALYRAGVESRMRVATKNTDDWTVSSYTKTSWRFRRIIGAGSKILTEKVYKSGVSSCHSFDLQPSRIDRIINKSDFNLINLHWLGDDFVSSEAIGRIRKPIVWTIHDMWAFCGSENYAPDGEEARFRKGYFKANRPMGESGPDMNRWLWRRKQKVWKNSITVVAPSRWLADCARGSALMRNWRIEIIPYAMDLKIWRPLPKEQVRILMNIPVDSKAILFAAIGGAKDQRKGFDLLLSALQSINNNQFEKPIILYVLGQSEPEKQPDLGFPIQWLGHIHDDLSLNMAFSASDVVVIPSRQDNLPNIGLESLASGTPVVAFNTGGLPDIVTHRKTGWLAKVFDPEDMAQGICWILEDDQRHQAISEATRTYAEEHFSADVVAKQYIDLYESVLRQ